MTHLYPSHYRSKTLNHCPSAALHFTLHSEQENRIYKMQRAESATGQRFDVCVCVSVAVYVRASLTHLRLWAHCTGQIVHANERLVTTQISALPTRPVTATNIHSCSWRADRVKDDQKHDINSTRQDRIATFTQNKRRTVTQTALHLDLYSLAVSLCPSAVRSGPPGWALMVAL